MIVGIGIVFCIVAFILIKGKGSGNRWDAFG